MASQYERQSTREFADARIAAAASNQHGAFSRLQAMEAGFTDAMIHRRLTAGRWDRLYAGVYRLAGSQATWRQMLFALCLAGGPGSVVSHRSAAALWKMAGFEEGSLELIVPRDRRRKLPAIVHRPVSVAQVDLTTVDGIPATRPARTLLDVAAVAPLHVVEEALDDALRRKLVSVSRMRWQLRESGAMGTPGRTVMRALIAARSQTADVPQSVFETRLLRVLKAAGLPEPVLQHEIRDRDRLVAVVDFAYPDARLAIEAEGYRWHSGRTRFERDLARRNALTALGWRVIHVSWSDLGTPEKVRRTVAAVLRRP
jgi:very-short-patch-repair endonuclease